MNCRPAGRLPSSAVPVLLILLNRLVEAVDIEIKAAQRYAKGVGLNRDRSRRAVINVEFNRVGQTVGLR